MAEALARSWRQPDVEMHQPTHLHDLPLFNQDDDAKDPSDAVKRMKEEIRRLSKA